MTLTPGQYLRKRREAAGLSIDDVAERILTVPRWAEHLRRGWLEQIEADEMPATFNTIVVLHQVMQFDLRILVALSVEGEDAPRLCASCACSEADPCVDHSGPCSWASNDLCSACFGLQPANRATTFQSARRIRHDHSAN